MPLVTISMLEGNSVEFKNKIHAAIHSALVSAFRIPEWDYNQKINEYSRNNWKIPDGKTGKYILMEVFVYPGRKKETKKKLFEEIVTNLEAIGIHRNDAVILLVEQPLENWGIRGGLPANEIDLGFKIHV